MIRNVLDDPQLSKEFKLRGLTRDPSKANAQELAKQGVEMVSCDLDDKDSIKAAVKGAHTVFANTVSLYDPAIAHREVEQGKTIADTCVAEKVSMLIYSSSTHVDQISNGKYKNVSMFNLKADVEDYIRTLPIPSCFYSPGSFMQNYVGGSVPRLSPANDGTYVLTQPFPESTETPLIDIDSDTGKFIGAILADPKKFEGKVIAAAERMYTFSEIVQIMSKVTGKTVKFQEVPADVFKGFLPPAVQTSVLEMLLHLSEFGYYGPKTRQMVEESSKLHRGKLTTLEEFVSKNLKLE